MSKQLSLFETTVLRGVSATGNTSGCYDFTANNLGLTKENMQEKVYRGKGSGFIGKWQHKVRLIQQSLKSKGLIENQSTRGNWKLTAKGKNELGFSDKGLKLYYTTANGMAFWGDSALIPEHFKGEIDLIITSPPYLLSTKAREYGHIGLCEKTYVDNLVAAIETWLPALTSTASIVLNIGNSIKKGEGYQNLHKERLLIALEDKLGLHLVQKFTWFSSSRMPSGHWVTKARRDCLDSTEDFYWLSLSPKSCKANNKNILVEYSDVQRKYMSAAKKKSGVRVKPSGQSSDDSTFYADNGGAIPSNLLLAVPESANSSYSRYCREHNLPRHPAMFNQSLPGFFIRYLTGCGDVVFEPYFGSGSTGHEAEIQERHWVGGEVARTYLDGSKGRFLHDNIPIQSYI